MLHYGWIPFIIYIGYTRSNPRPTFIKYSLTLLHDATKADGLASL